MSLFTKFLRVKNIEDNVNVVRVPRTGYTQVAKSDSANNSTVIIHTVTAGKTLFLIGASCLFASSAVGDGKLLITNAADAEQYALFDYHIGTTAANCGIGAYNPSIPLEIPEGYKIKVFSSATGVDVSGFIQGYEV